MNVDPQRVDDLLDHIVHAIDRINNYTKSDEAEFLANEMAQDAVIRNLEIIGEASRGIEKRFPEFAKEHSELPLRNAYEMHMKCVMHYLMATLKLTSQLYGRL